jgi:tRNA threonylcarbamoyladenosine biosynthesis protein TsaE
MKSFTILILQIKTETEAWIGVDDYLYSGNWCFIECRTDSNLIPEEHSVIRIRSKADGKRVLELSKSI